MSLATHFQDNKHKMFPHIEDWTDPQDEMRYEKNVKKLNYAEWFFFHPSSYSILTYGTWIVVPITWGVFFFFFDNPVMRTISIIFIAYSLFKLTKLIIHRKLNKDMTFYDIWMREY